MIMSRFLDLMRLSAKSGKMIIVPDCYLQDSYAEHRQKKGLKSSIAPRLTKLFVNSKGDVLTINDYKRIHHKF